jgi:DNA-binding transcriptional MerR regulator
MRSGVRLSTTKQIPLLSKALEVRFNASQDTVGLMTTATKSERYGIKEVSQKFDIPASTLRYYEKVGLLENVGRDANGQRVYDDSHIERLDSIICFKIGGLPIAKICEFYRYDNDLEAHIDDIISLVENHENGLRRSIAELQHELVHIHQKVEFYHGIKEAIGAQRPWPAFEDFAPESAENERKQDA